jgi:hypothetical protein
MDASVPDRISACGNVLENVRVACYSDVIPQMLAHPFAERIRAVQPQFFRVLGRNEREIFRETCPGEIVEERVVMTGSEMKDGSRSFAAWWNKEMVHERVIIPQFKGVSIGNVDQSMVCRRDYAHGIRE